MSSIVPVTEFITYLLYSLLVGYIVLQLVPDKMKPVTLMSKRTVYFILLGIILFSLGSVFNLIIYFQNAVDFKWATYSVFVKTEIGKAWIFSSMFAIVLCLNIFGNGKKIMNVITLLLMISTIGFAGHITSLDFWTGFIFQNIHFLVVSIWSGILFHVAWLSKETTNYTNFLKWFTPLAVGCVLIIFVSGIVLMLKVVKIQDYTTAWLLPYGQMLLLKHITIIPVLFFAFINGFLIKKSIENPTFNIRSWLKAESIVLTLVFFFTGVMSTKSSPHEIDLTIRTEGSSKWIERIIGIDIEPTMQLHFFASMEGIMLIGMSLIFLVLLVLSFIKKINVMLPILFALCFIMTMYMGLMYSVTA
ncbi:copper resistance D family protein [Bacillus sp. AFS041924]|uniref:copper resistance D family protein n=1 Tax=Bacillus sp. AFS041924 TaxID=2033503 RepID=UPI000BFCE70D|nr:CopD family protein [Bacillus sp. AFS041924]PGS48719.1 hypothetical protein COC46_16970 [Bacillus sp. AFS041924]